MASVSTRPGGDYSPQAMRTSDRSDRVAFYERWLRVWIALGAVVVLVVVVFLIFISNALSGINFNLGNTASAVEGVGGNTKTLPGQISSVNGSLSSIATALSPITGDATKIISNLTSIEGNLTTTSASLVNTSGVLSGVSGTLVGISGTLNTVSGSLVNTSGVLTTVLGLAGSIHTTLVNANAVNGNCNAPETFSQYNPPAGATSAGSFSCAANQLGVQNIHQRVAIADNVLNVAQTDLTDISGNLTKVNSSLVSACNGLTVSVLKIVSGGGSC
ncbi:MAG: hypothetical protein ACRDX8_08960 [Acidimicrobiales bacterium]